MGTDTFTITVNGTAMTAAFEDNPSAEALESLLLQGPLTIDMHDYGSMEKVGPIGQSLPQSNEQITTQPGDVILYQGNQLTIYYAQNTWNFTRVGKIQNMSADELKSILGSGDPTVTFSL